MSPKDNIVSVVSDIPELMRLWSKVDNPLGLASKTCVNSKNVKATWICTECNSPYRRTVRDVYLGKTVCQTCTSRKNAYDYIKNKLASEGSFADNYPERALDWDYEDERNKPYKPSDFLSGSNKLVYWKCHVCGHKSDTPTMICNHAKAMYPCERCAIQGRTNQRYGENPITKTNPELLLEWDFEKNTKDGIYPENITNHDTQTHVHWSCKRGHHWSKSVSYRLHTAFDCPYCKKELQTSFPEQAVFFYLSKVTEVINGYKIPNNSHIDIFMPLLNVGVEYDGEPFHSSENSKRIENWKDNYAIENGIKLYRIIESEIFGREGNKIFVIKDKKNSQVQYPIHIICNELGLHQPPINIDKDCIQINEQYRTREKEKSIANLFPHLLDEWDYEKNGNIDPECISCGSSSINIYWKCKEGHSWSAPPFVRTKGCGCPFCAGVRFIPGVGDLQSQRPDLAKEWDFEQNDKKPWEVSANSSEPYWWICSKCKHYWRTSVANRNSGGTGCDECAKEKRLKSRHKTLVIKKGSLVEKYPDLLLDWNWSKNKEIDPYSIPPRVGFNVAWKCHICGKEWEKSPDCKKRCISTQRKRRYPFTLKLSFNGDTKIITFYVS